ncbi:MAG: hypothetical protein HeimC2_38560 [Candidatus Heimdallarchaeota archaeon LC_2]|nr:MAG: hypothetical protein HeimC2_38560 [Candidatus Heimdallarchaeota archaeon LC_2]
MSEEKEEIIQKQLDLDEKTDSFKKKSRLKRWFAFVDSILNRLIPNFAPKIIIEEKLIENEKNIDYAMIKYYSEIQILLGLVIFILGALAASFSNGLYLIVSILGVFLVFTGFDIEEIYVTNIRLLIRRIGLLERIIRVPADEEHLLKHIVSFNIGRAPTHKILMGLAAIGFINAITFIVVNLVGMIISITSLVFFILGLRLGKRVVTLNLAGGHTIVLGIRKGVPRHLIQSIMKSTFRE